MEPQEERLGEQATCAGAGTGGCGVTARASGSSGKLGEE